MTATGAGQQTPANDNRGSAANENETSAEHPAEVALPDPPSDDGLNDTPNADYLATLELAHVRVSGRLYLVWVVDTYPTRARGLMFVEPDELAPLPDGTGRGMLFVWQHDNSTGFWMRNTITPLDIAFIREDGTVVNTHTMEPLDENTYDPAGPYRFALEVNAGDLTDLNVQPDDVIQLPDVN